MTEEQVESLIDYIERQGECDNSHRYTREWAELHGLDAEPLIESLAQYGGCCCDCEVAINVPDRFYETEAVTNALHLHHRRPGE
jgi:hypothetical protein